MHGLRTLVARFVAAALVGVAILTPALAHAAAPPTPGLRRGAPAWLGFGVIFLLAVVVLSVSLLPSKRGHRD